MLAKGSGGKKRRVWVPDDEGGTFQQGSSGSCHVLLRGPETILRLKKYPRNLGDITNSGDSSDTILDRTESGWQMQKQSM